MGTPVLSRPVSARASLACNVGASHEKAQRSPPLCPSLQRCSSDWQAVKPVRNAKSVHFGLRVWGQLVQRRFSSHQPPRMKLNPPLRAQSLFEPRKAPRSHGQRRASPDDSTVSTLCNSWMVMIFFCSPLREHTKHRTTQSESP